MSMDREATQYWQQRKREMMRHNRQSGGGWRQRTPVTFVLIILLALGWLVQVAAPGLNTEVGIYGGRFALIAVSTILPGSFIGLIFDGLFVWLIGSQLEHTASTWQYLVIFFGAGIVGSTVIDVMGGLGGALSVFGVAGGYVYAMAHFNYGGAVRWALFLLVINVVLSGFDLPVLLAMAAAFATGLGLSWSMGVGGR
jgi:membrane associated rhomboid family serine protease